MKPIENIRIARILLIGAIVGGIGGAFLFDEILYQLARIILGLSNAPIISLLLPSLVVMILCAIGTFITVVAFRIQNTRIKVWTLIFSLLVPSVIEVIDLTVRAFILFSELSERNTFL